jgi:AcrR family transcriptional regulator
MTSGPSSTRGKPKGDKRARTRTKLLDAARDLIREKGFESVTLQDVAQRAGMTSGAIYGNFKNRDDLFMALAQRQWGPIKPVFARGSSFAEKMRALAEATIAAVPERRVAAVGALMFRSYALTHEEIRVRVRDSFAQGYKDGAEWFESVTEDGELPMPADILVRVINAMIEGLLFQRFMTPELVPDEVFFAAFGALANRK